MNKDVKTMKEFVNSLGNSIIPIRSGELFEVKILQILKNKMLVDVGGWNLGIIPEQEFSPDMEELKEGDKILAYVLTIENDDGYVVLSLRRADKERVSKILKDKFESGEVLQVKATDANKGGLLCQFGEYEGFLPVSQLATSHYPKVISGNREEILNRLKDLVGKNLQIKILTFEPNSGKLIFSEKAAGDLVQQEKIKNIKIGQKFEGEITGIVNFGLFIKVKTSSKDEVEGLVHISETSWEHIDDLKEKFKVGQNVKAEVISTEGNRLSLSIKKLLPDPWFKLAKAYKIGQEVEAEVTKITPFGAFVKVGGVDGLVHVSELGEKVADPKDIVKEGKSYKFEIIAIETESNRIHLSLKKIKKSTIKKIPKTAKKKLKKKNKKGE